MTWCALVRSLPHLPRVPLRPCGGDPLYRARCSRQQRHHAEHECPAALARSVMPDLPALARQCSPSGSARPGEWRQTSESRWRVPVATLAPSLPVVILIYPRDHRALGRTGCAMVTEFALARVDPLLRDQDRHRGARAASATRAPNGAAHGHQRHPERDAPRRRGSWTFCRRCAWIDTAPVLAHNAAFDRKITRARVPRRGHARVDTKAMEAAGYPRTRATACSPLAAALEAPHGHRAHRAPATSAARRPATRLTPSAGPCLPRTCSPARPPAPSWSLSRRSPRRSHPVSSPLVKVTARRPVPAAGIDCGAWSRATALRPCASTSSVFDGVTRDMADGTPLRLPPGPVRRGTWSRPRARVRPCAARNEGPGLRA